MSTRVEFVANCWPPMACLPPATLTPRPSRLAARTTDCTASMESGRTTLCTFVGFRWEWTSLTKTPSLGDSAEGRGMQPETVVAMPAFAASSRKSRLDIIAPPNWRPGARDRSGSDEDRPERSALNDVVECVVIEVDRVNAYMKALHPGRDESECEARQSPANCGIRPATICRDERAEKKERARKIG